MSYGKMTTPVVIVRQTPQQDGEGFASVHDVLVADTVAYKEDRHGSTAWANRAAFSEATSMFRFRVIPGVTVEPLFIIVCQSGRYEVLSVENAGQRGMYVEVLAKKIEPVGG